MREEGRNGKKRKTLLWGGNVSKIYSSMIFWTSFVSKIMKITFQKLTKETLSFFWKLFLNIFRELRSTFIGWLNLNKILWEILALVTTNTLLEFNFLSSIQLTMETHLWCHHNQSKSAWCTKTSKPHKRAPQDGMETDPMLSQSYT